MSTAEVLQRLTAALDRAGISYMLTGSFASSYYGASRSTQDIDFVIESSPEQLRTFVGSLSEGNYYVEMDAATEAILSRSMFNVIDLSTGWKVDLIIRKSRPFSEEEFRRRLRVELNGVPLFITTAEDIIIAKMEWAKMSGSTRQLEDVAAILRLQWNVLDLAYLENWAASLQLRPQWEESREQAGIGEQR
jgi:hypothetical protein